LKLSDLNHYKLYVYEGKFGSTKLMLFKNNAWESLIVLNPNEDEILTELYLEEMGKHDNWVNFESTCRYGYDTFECMDISDINLIDEWYDYV